MKVEQMERIIRYCPWNLSKEQLWNWVCDYLTETLYWDLDDNQTGPTDEQLEEVENVFNQVIN
jgi:hypothetical protein